MELFKHGPSLVYRWFLLSILALFILVLDHRDHQTQFFRQLMSVIVLPVQYAVQLPVQWVGSVHQQFTYRETLIADNNLLKKKELYLEAKIQQIESLEKENDRLRALLGASPRGVQRVEAAELLSIDANPYSQLFTVARGSKQQVYYGQPVIDADGVVGQVIKVGWVTSQVLLLTDPRSAVPVEDGRSGIRGILNGNGSANTLSLMYISKTADIQTGDLLMTSGLGGRFPAGLPVGKVISVQNIPGEHFALIDVEPLAQLNRTQMVLLIWPENPINERN